MFCPRQWTMIESGGQGIWSSLALGSRFRGNGDCIGRIAL